MVDSVARQLEKCSVRLSFSDEVGALIAASFSCEGSLLFTVGKKE